MYCIILTLRSFRSGDRIGLGPSEDGGVYVNVSSLSFRQPLAAEFASALKDGIVSTMVMETVTDGNRTC